MYVRLNRAIQEKTIQSNTGENSTTEQDKNNVIQDTRKDTTYRTKKDLGQGNSTRHYYHYYFTMAEKATVAYAL